MKRKGGINPFKTPCRKIDERFIRYSKAKWLPRRFASLLKLYRIQYTKSCSTTRLSKNPFILFK